MVLVDTGTSRSSGLSNWDMLKRHLDGDAAVRAAMDRIIEAGHAVRESLLAGDLDGAGRGLAAEWEARRRLSPAVSDRIIDGIIAAGLQWGALAGKVCGAGGGGCVVLWVKEGRREEVARRLAAAGATILDFRCRASGVEITES
jgi:D-glycero-alpha-D-manno-heptose-7-phosphate kinase